MKKFEMTEMVTKQKTEKLVFQNNLYEYTMTNNINYNK